MPSANHQRNTLLWIGLLAIAVTALWRPQGQAQAQQGFVGSWEYAIITFRAQDAVVFTNNGSFFMEGPEVRNPERVSGESTLRLIRPVEVEHLTTLGKQGWEVVRPWGANGSSLLIRRGI